MAKRMVCVAAVLALCGAAGADSLFTQAAAKAGTLVSEKTSRFQPGDIITVLVREEISASTIADTNTKKESDVDSQSDADKNEFLVADAGLNILNPEELPNWNVGMKNEQKTTGKTRRTSSLTTTVTCFVTQVFSNGNIMIEGEKGVTVNREASTVVVSGMVRSTDVTPANTVLSTQMANVQVHLRGQGPLWNNQRRGLVTRFLDWFSPF